MNKQRMIKIVAALFSLTLIIVCITLVAQGNTKKNNISNESNTSGVVEPEGIKPTSGSSKNNKNNKKNKKINVVEETTKKKKRKKNVPYPYLIKINRVENFVIVYAMDQDGFYSIPYKGFICSTGLYEDYTPTGTFTISDKYEWRLMVDGSYAQYAMRINGPIMLHSVPYTRPNKSYLEVEEFAKLGKPASLGCIRLCVRDVKWIYDNCPAGTKVVLYNYKDEISSLTIKKPRKAKTSGIKAGWDPTDPDSANPWNNKSGK